MAEDQAREMMRVLQDVIVEARFHRRDRELLAARSSAQQDGQVRILFADAAEQQESVDPARTVIREDDVERPALEDRRQLVGLLDLDGHGIRETGLEGLSDQTPIARTRIDDENPQRFAAETAARIPAPGR